MIFNIKKMKNLFDQVQERANQLGAIIVVILGVAMLTSGSWALHETLDSETRAYFVIGYLSGTRLYPAKALLSELNSALAPYITILKGSFSTVILLGLVQIVGGALAFKLGQSRQVLIGWISCLVLVTLLSLTSAIVPLAVGITGFIQLQVVSTIAVLNSFILLHIIGVLGIELRKVLRGQTTARGSSRGSGSSTKSSRSRSRGNSASNRTTDTSIISVPTLKDSPLITSTAVDKQP